MNGLMKMKAKLSVNFVILFSLFLCCHIFAQEQKESEATTAYRALLKRADAKPASVTEAQWHHTIAAELEKFAAEHADQPEAADARRDRLQHLQDGARIDPAVKTEFWAASDAAWKDNRLDADERANARMLQLLLEHKDEVPGNELLTLWNEFPGSDTVGAALATTITETIDPELRNKMLMVLRDTPGTSEKRRVFATKILSGEVRPLAARVGQSFSLRYKALDGREVNLETLRGKVVLVDFWATWCGPCVAEMPHVRELYEQLHDKGFEIVGISFDSEKVKLETYVRKNKIPWSQYFDGKMWDNEIGQGFALRNLPTMALVDKAGVLRFANARKDYATRIKELLAE
jgi:thiol-disulfide isomerase/thioredoxin